jgi:tRNA (guanine-N7-)-methyltransferase
MINDENSDEVDKIGTLKFDEKLDFKTIKKNFQEITLRGDGFFAHLEEIFEINEDEGLVRVSFGSSSRNEHNYIFITKEKVSYLPDNVLATKDNQNAHKLIKEQLWNM